MEEKFSRVEVITGISKIAALQSALGKFRITGMTVYQVLGCGVQHGTQEFEVEEKKEIQLLPKEVVMIVLPIASKSAVDPLTWYSFSVNSSTSNKSFLLTSIFARKTKSVSAEFNSDSFLENSSYAAEIFFLEARI